MSRLITLYLGLEAIAIAVYCWLLRGWIGWKSVGPAAFPGSPDASWLYSSASQGYQWATGFLEGVWLAGIVGALILKAPTAQPNSRLRNSLLIAIGVLPPGVLVVGHLLEGRIR
jgi:hypothetical protein